MFFHFHTDLLAFSKLSLWIDYINFRVGSGFLKSVFVSLLDRRAVRVEQAEASRRDRKKGASHFGRCCAICSGNKVLY